MNRQRHLLSAWETRTRTRRQTRTSRPRPGHREEGAEDRGRRGSRENIVRGRKEAVRGENTGRERISTQHTVLPENTPGRTPGGSFLVADTASPAHPCGAAAEGGFTRRDWQHGVCYGSPPSCRTHTHGIIAGDGLPGLRKARCSGFTCCTTRRSSLGRLLRNSLLRKFFFLR